MPVPALDREWRPPEGGRYGPDLLLPLGPFQHGGADPTVLADRSGRAVWRTCLTPDGPGTIRYRQDGRRVIGQAWGPGAGWLLDGLPAQLGAEDEPGELRITGDDEPSRRLAAIARGLAGPRARPAAGAGAGPAAGAAAGSGLRIGSGKRMLEVLIPAVLEQKVLTAEAHRAWCWLLRRHGTEAPGPEPASTLRVFPEPAVWARIPSWDWHRAGVEPSRSRTITGLARLAGRLERLSQDQADQALRSLPGIGPWTSAETRQRAYGDPDAISVGDYHLPARVGWTLAGDRDTDDAGMLALLARYTGQRYRVQRLIELGGTAPPRHGPRLAVRDYRSF